MNLPRANATEVRNINYGERFYVDGNPNTFHRLRPSPVSHVRLPDENEVFGIDQDFRLESFPPETPAHPMK